MTSPAVSTLLTVTRVYTLTNTACYCTCTLRHCTCTLSLRILVVGTLFEGGPFYTHGPDIGVYSPVRGRDFARICEMWYFVVIIAFSVLIQCVNRLLIRKGWWKVGSNIVVQVCQLIILLHLSYFQVSLKIILIKYHNSPIYIIQFYRSKQILPRFQILNFVYSLLEPNNICSNLTLITEP